MSPTPALSVVVRAVGDASQLVWCLWSILRQPGPVEVIVAADPSGLGSTVAHRLARTDERVRVLHTTSSAPTPLLDAGLAVARGRYVALLDSGTRMADDSVALVEILDKSGSDLLIADPTNKACAKGRTEIEPGITATTTSLFESPELVLAGGLSDRVFRRAFLQAHRPDWEEGQQPSDDRVFLIHTLCLAGSVDLVRGQRFAHPSEESTPQAPVWGASGLRQLDVLAEAHPAARSLLNERLLAELVAIAPSLLVPLPEATALARRVVETAPLGSLARLKVHDRWRLALILLGRPELQHHLDPAPDATTDDSGHLDALDSPLPDSLASVLGLGDDPVHHVFQRRFLRPDPPEVGRITDSGPPEISVVVPTHNVEEYVGELLESVRAAQGVRLEIIVVDDHSTDRTWQILQRHAAQDARLTIVPSPGRGGGEARNAGVALARGEWLCFADGDDIVPPGAYAAMLAAARRTGAEIVTASYEKFGETWRWDGGELFGYDAELDNVDLDRHPRLITHRVCWNRLYRLEFWRVQGLSFPNVARANDVVPVTKALVAARRISVVPVLSYRYRTRPQSMTSTQGSSPATVSYLTQEATAARIVGSRTAPQVVREYWSTILPHDCWRHVRAYLLGDLDDQARAVADRLTELLGMAPDDAHDLLSPAQRAVYALVCHHEYPAARALITAVDRVGRLNRPTALGIPQVIETITALRRIGELTPEDLAHILVVLVVRKLERSEGALDPGDVGSISELMRALTPAEARAFTAGPGTRHEHLINLLKQGTPDQVRAALADGGAPIPVTLRSRGGRAWLTSSGTGLGPAWMLASHKSMVDLPVGSVGPDDQGQQVLLRAAEFPLAGTWRLSLVAQDQWGTLRSPLAITQRGRGRLAGLRVADAGGTRVIRRPSLWRRARGALARIGGLETEPPRPPDSARAAKVSLIPTRHPGAQSS